MKNSIVLDASALIAYLKGENGANLVKKYLTDKQNSVFMHAVNLYEVYYYILDKQPLFQSVLMNLIKSLNIQIYHRIDRRIMEESANYKISYRISLGDSIVLGFTHKLNATMLTSDRKDFGEIANLNLVKIKFIR